MPPTHRPVPLHRFRADALALGEDAVAVESPLQIRVAFPSGRVEDLSLTMRTPGDDFALAVGFLRGEGIVRAGADLAHTEPDPTDPPDVCTVHLRVDVDLSPLRRLFASTSACGVCGRASVDQLAELEGTVDRADGFTVAARTLCALPARLRVAQPAFEHTGGLHATGLFDRHGALRFACEDVGRHNAMDKALGRALLAGDGPLRETLALVSGRASFELVQKAARAGVPVLCAVSAPSTLAVETADRAGLTLVGFLRDGGFNVYTHAGRVLDGEEA